MCWNKDQDASSSIELFNIIYCYSALNIISSRVSILKLSKSLWMIKKIKAESNTLINYDLRAIIMFFVR